MNSRSTTDKKRETLYIKDNDTWEKDKDKSDKEDNK